MTAPIDNQRVTCLLVDDLKANLLALKALLQGPDVEVLTAESGTEALELLLMHDVALVMLDVQMPEMDGFEVAELMRGSERTRHIPIIFITAGAHDQARLFRGYDSGAVDFLHKPVEAHVLQNKAAVFFDLHRHKRRLARELDARNRALRINEMFMAVLSHDLRSPLGAIQMGASAMQRRHADDPPSAALCASMLSSCARMRGMIDDLLDVARARIGGGLPVAPRAADLGEVVQGVADEHRMSHPSRQIDVSCDGELDGQWDPDRLAQLVANLLGNALKHGSPDSAIGIVLDGSDADAVRLAIHNAGPIPEHVLPHLFDPFHAGKPTLRRDDGLGLGLYIAQQIASAHRAVLNVHSDADSGTRIVVDLPRNALSTGSAESP